MLVLYFNWTRKVSTDVSQYHDHNHNFQMGYRNLKDMNDNFDLPQKQNHNLLENISKIEQVLTKKILEMIIEREAINILFCIIFIV